MATTVDPWNDGWERHADQEAVKVKSEVAEAAEGNGSSSGSSTTSNSSSLAAPSAGPKILAKRVPAEEENRKIWEAANATNPFEVVASTTAPIKIANFKPELKILKRAPPATIEPKTVSTNSESPAILDRKEKERRYAEARERLFGPASSTTSNESTSSVATTPTVGMSRSSSSSGLGSKNGEAGSGSTTPSRERGGVRGGKKGGRGGNSGNNTPRSRSPGRNQRGSDTNRTSGIVGGITKVTENGWVYTGTGQTPRTASPASNKLMGMDTRVRSPSIATISAGIGSMNLNPQGGFNSTNNPHQGVPNPWGMGGAPGALGQRPQVGFIPSSQTYPSQQYYGPNQSYQMTQPPPPPPPPPPSQFPQYSGPPAGFNPPPHSYQQQQHPPSNNFTPYQTSAPPGVYKITPTQQPHPSPQPQQPQPPQQRTISPSHINYPRPFPQPSTGPSPLSSAVPTPTSRYEPNTGTTRTIYIPDPCAFTSRPPPPQGNILPGYGNHSNTPGDGNGDSVTPIRKPRGPDMNMGNGFSGRGGRGGGFNAP